MIWAAPPQQQSSDDGALAIWPHGYHIHGLGGFVVHRLVNQGAFGQKFQRGIPILGFTYSGADPDHHNYALKRVRDGNTSSAPDSRVSSPRLAQ